MRVQSLYSNVRLAINRIILGLHFANLLIMDPCIIVQFKEKKTQQDATMYQNFIIPYLYEAQHVIGDTPPIIRSLKLHWQPLVLHTWKVVGHVTGGQHPSTFHV
jgi:hypothetical protein